MKDFFEEIIRKIESATIDNKTTITNVKLFASGWRKESALDAEYVLLADVISRF